MITYESISVDTQDAGVYRVHYVQNHGSVAMGGTLVFDRANTAYVAQEVEARCEYASAETDVHLGPDHLRIYQSGSDQQLFVNVICRRDPAQPHGGLSGVSMTIPYAMGLAGILRGLGR